MSITITNHVSQFIPNGLNFTTGHQIFNYPASSTEAIKQGLRDLGQHINDIVSRGGREVSPGVVTKLRIRTEEYQGLKRVLEALQRDFDEIKDLIGNDDREFIQSELRKLSDREVLEVNPSTPQPPSEGVVREDQIGSDALELIQRELRGFSNWEVRKVNPLKDGHISSRVMTAGKL